MEISVGRWANKESEKGKGQFRRFATPGKWKENFTDEEKKTVENMIGDTLRKMGY